jgi:YidC/Oxa1 family membrane protein insertase
LKALQAKYKDDKQRQQQEIMKFYKENKVNPLASCLPLAAQFPVFISLYYLLRSDLRGYICPNTQLAYKLAHHTTATIACGVHNGAQFLFIPDLTNKATGAVLIVLMVLYVGSQLFSSLMMSTSAMDPTQRKIMVLMPLVFVFLFISFPAGVIVYWITTNLWTIVQQVIVRRIVGPPPVAAGATAAKASSEAAVAGGSGTAAPVAKPASGGGKRSADGAKPPAGTKPAAGGKSTAGTKTAGGGAKPDSNGAKSSVGGLLRRRLEPASEPSGAGGGRSGGGGAPPRPPRKKKKRSGRRR